MDKHLINYNYINSHYVQAEPISTKPLAEIINKYHSLIRPQLREDMGTNLHPLMEED